jgi:CubicO group peptidase (beta-lactamase class C family)/peptidoglycan/LPS O-acetylase OafA/YrhL
MGNGDHRPDEPLTSSPFAADDPGVDAVHPPRGASDPPLAGGPDRERGLDALRTIALARVVLWHAFGAAAITYVVAAVPAMFFVSGSLLAKSYLRRPTFTVLADRMRRILVPLWALAAVAYVAMWLAWRIAPSEATQVPWRGIVLWLVPLADPGGSAWEGGYLSSPLWYVRTMVWVLALSPLAIAALRRAPAITLGALVAGVVALDQVNRRPSWRVDALPDLVWQAGDVVLFTIFLLLGVLHRDGAFGRLHRRDLVTLALVCAAGAQVWVLTQPVPDMVVNNSHPMHLLVGAAWLFLALAAMPWLERLAASERSGLVIRWVSQRTMTIYLWHPVGIVVTYLALRRVGTLPPGVWSVAVVVGTVAVTAVGVLLFGWIEDVAAGRPPRWCPSVLDGPHLHPNTRRRLAATRRRRMTGIALAGVAMLALASTTIKGTEDDAFAGRRPPVPSQAPERADFDTGAIAPTLDETVAASRVAVFGAATRAPVAALAPDAPPELAARLQAVVEDWAQRWGVPGAEIGLLRVGEVTWRTAVGTDPTTGRALDVDARFDIGSVTKTFTAAVALRLVEQGVLSLDTPLPRLRAAPTFDATRFTLRQLLTHRTGLVNYRNTPEYRADISSVSSPQDAVTLSGRQPLQFAPGTRSNYSSTNYLVVGLLVEQVGGVRISTAFDQLFDTYGLDDTEHLPPYRGAPNFSTGGVLTTTDDLLRWTVALYRDHAMLAAPSWALMSSLDPETSLGAGSFGYCPCARALDGSPWWRYIGHSGGTTTVQYSAGDDLAVVVNVTDDLWLEARGGFTTDLVERLRLALAS